MIARIYVAGPYTKGDLALNVRHAFEAASRLADLGFAPFVPHATHFWHMLFPRPYEFWLELDNQFLPCCSGLLRLPGDSSGADKEVELAKTLGIPVFTSIDALAEHFKIGLLPRSEAFGPAAPLAAVLGHIEQGVQQLQVVDLYVAALAGKSGGNMLILRFGDLHASQHITGLRISVNTP
jgi:hypothetical protein